MEEPDPVGVALRLALLRERPLRDRAKTRLAAVEAARGRLLALAPTLRQQLERPLGDSDRRLAGRLARVLADCSPKDLAEALEGLRAAELTAPGELEGLLGWYGVCLDEFGELEEELLETLRPLAQDSEELAATLARAEVARAEARLGEARLESELLWRLAEAADEADWAKSAGRAPVGDCRVWNGKPAAWEEAGEEQAQELEKGLEGLPEHIWCRLESLGLFGPEWERWAEAASNESRAEDDLWEARREAERREKPQHPRPRPPRPAVAATPTSPLVPAEAPQPAVAPPVPDRVLSPPPRCSRRPRRGPARLYRRGLLSMRLRVTLLVAASTVGWLVAAAVVTAPVVWLAAVGHWEGAAALGGGMAVLAGPYALPDLLEAVKEVREEVSCRTARFRRRQGGRT